MGWKSVCCTSSAGPYECFLSFLLKVKFFSLACFSKYLTLRLPPPKIQYILTPMNPHSSKTHSCKTTLFISTYGLLHLSSQCRVCWFGQHITFVSRLHVAYMCVCVTCVFSEQGWVRISLLAVAWTSPFGIQFELFMTKCANHCTLSHIILYII